MRCLQVASNNFLERFANKAKIRQQLLDAWGHSVWPRAAHGLELGTSYIAQTILGSSIIHLLELLNRHTRTEDRHDR